MRDTERLQNGDDGGRYVRAPHISFARRQHHLENDPDNDGRTEMRSDFRDQASACGLMQVFGEETTRSASYRRK